MQCLFILLPFWGIIRLHKSLFLGIAGDSNLVQEIFEFPPLPVASTVRSLEEQKKPDSYTYKDNAVIVSISEEQRAMYEKKRQLIDEEASRVQKRRVSYRGPRRKQREATAEAESLAFTPNQYSKTIPSYIPVGRPKKRPPSQLSFRNNTLPAKYAYAFVMGGVNEQDGKYKGMLYNILIASYILQNEGSRADIVVFVQMSVNSTQTELPEEDKRLLKALNVQVRYLVSPLPPTNQAQIRYDTDRRIYLQLQTSIFYVLLRSQNQRLRISIRSSCKS